MRSTENTKRENIHARGGWSFEETDTLFEEARAAGKDGRPIKSVFDKVAVLTGRKPNSIRNYYYLKLKENDDMGKTTFIPFEEDEVRELVRTMLIEQAKGKSVRSIAFEMGNGDKKAMLRYQNKYRSMIRNNPEFVRRAMAELKDEGEEIVNPFMGKHKRNQLRRNRDVTEIAMEFLGNLSKVGKDGETIINSLNNIFSAAVSGMESDDMDVAQLKVQKASLLEQVERLSTIKKQLTAELAKQITVNSELERRLSTLESLNRGFISLAGMEKISGLSEYVSAISKCISN